MQYAVIETGGKQYKINAGQMLDIDNLNLKEGDSITFDKVLLVVSDETVELGAPYLENTKVTAKVVDTVKGDKVKTSRFKAKSHYNRTVGIRPVLTRIEISDIQTGSNVQKAAKKSKKE